MPTVTTLNDFSNDPQTNGPTGTPSESSTSQNKYPIESNGTTLHGSPQCPECGEIGSYEGAGSTTVSNWSGRSFTARYCSECDLRYRVHAAANESPTIH